MQRRLKSASRERAKSRPELWAAVAERSGDTAFEAPRTATSPHRITQALHSELPAERQCSPLQGPATQNKAPSPVVASLCRRTPKSRQSRTLDCGGRAQRRHRFRSTSNCHVTPPHHPSPALRITSRRATFPTPRFRHPKRSAVAGRSLPLSAHSKDGDRFLLRSALQNLTI